MSEYLSKEEIKQWRSSLEKITLEEFAARLGKKIEEAKPTNDLVDIVLKGKPVVSTQEEWMRSRGERLSAIAERAMIREREISPTPFSIDKLKKDIESKEQAESLKEDSKKVSQSSKPAKTLAKKTAKKEAKPLKAVKDTKKTKEVKSQVAVKALKTPAKKVSKKAELSLRDEVRIVFKKALTDREQKVFDYFAANSNKIVYAKDLAELLELPRDYVYKYIKNLRAKIEGENLTNADKGGFILSV